ncbi:MAG: hypothetical protein QM733_07610 [Ilumatobacteraceae bacterium]
MQTRHPLRAALVAMLVPLVAIAAFGNSWFTEKVRFDRDHGPLVTRLLAMLAPFTWTFTPRRGGDASRVLWFAQALSIVVVVGGVFLVTWAVARHATGSSLFLSAWGTTVLVAMLGAFVVTIVGYGTLFGSANPDGLGRFWHSVFQAPEAALWGAGVGVVVGAFAAALVGGVDTRPTYQTSAPLPGTAPVWQPTQVAPAQPVAATPPPPWAQQTYVDAPVVTAPPVIAQPLATPPVPPPARPLGDPTVVMVQPGEQPPSPAGDR